MGVYGQAPTQCLICIPRMVQRSTWVQNTYSEIPSVFPARKRRASCSLRQPSLLEWGDHHRGLGLSRWGSYSAGHQLHAPPVGSGQFQGTLGQSRKKYSAVVLRAS